jgi:type I restriction enzyme R subunit
MIPGQSVAKPLTQTDLTELESVLLQAGVGDQATIDRARATSHGFGRFIRALVGLDRTVVTEAFGDFLNTGTATAAQIEFISMVIDHLTTQGILDPALLYEQPFVALAPTGPEHLFTEAKITTLIGRISEMNASAAA